MKLPGDSRTQHQIHRRILLKLTDYSADVTHLEQYPEIKSIIKYNSPVPILFRYLNKKIIDHFLNKIMTIPIVKWAINQETTASNSWQKKNFSVRNIRFISIIEVIIYFKCFPIVFKLNTDPPWLKYIHTAFPNSEQPKWTYSWRIRQSLMKTLSEHLRKYPL